MSGNGTYTTVQGDKWDSVCFKEFGSTEHVDRLMMLNLEHIRYYVFPAGIVLELPEVSAEDSSYTLPPWKETNG